MKQVEHRVVVSGSAWMGSGIGSIESAIREMLASADDRVDIVAYSISAGAFSFLEYLEAALGRGCRVRMTINRFYEQDESTKSQILRIARLFPHLFELYSFEPRREKSDLHAKIIVVDGQYALVGSANLSLRGLLDNHELGILVTGQAIVDIMSAIDSLIAFADTLRVTANR